MVRTTEQLDKWRERDGFDGHLVMQIHDELVFDFPKKGNPKEDSEKEKKETPPRFGLRLSTSSNLWRVRELQRLMSLGGEDIGIPTPVSCEFHEDNWSEGESL